MSAGKGAGCKWTMERALHADRAASFKSLKEQSIGAVSARSSACFTVSFASCPFPALPCRDLHHSLMHQRIREDVLAADEEMVDIIKQISELMVYGDKHSESFFDFFAEKSMMKLLVELYKTRSDAVRIQIIQTLSIFFMNIRNDRALCECWGGEGGQAFTEGALQLPTR